MLFFLIENKDVILLIENKLEWAPKALPYRISYIEYHIEGQAEAFGAPYSQELGRRNQDKRNLDA